MAFQTERLDASRPGDTARAAAILRNGGTVAFPTETVYGLGANALSAEAVEKIFIAKQRPHWDPLIVHIAEESMLAKVSVPHSSRPHRDEWGDRSRTTQALIEAFWPGPLTLLLPRTAAIPDIVTAGRPLVGVRMPAHDVARSLIHLAGVPIAAPSANTFGHTSPTTAAHVLADLDGRIDAVLDGGPATIGLESTVAEPTSDGVIVYRPGGADLHALPSHLGLWIRPATPPGAPHLASEMWDGITTELPEDPQSLPSPGFGIRHYAPRARLILVDGLKDEEIVRSGKPLEMLEHSLVPAIDRAFDGEEIIGVMLPENWNPSCAQLTYPWGPWRDGETLARRLFAGLRHLDDRGATTILCPVPELPGIGEAIRDRLAKAARPR